MFLVSFSYVMFFCHEFMLNCYVLMVLRYEDELVLKLHCIVGILLLLINIIMRLMDDDKVN